MLRTAITPQESISSPATIPETITVAKFSNPQVNEISAEKKESKQEVDLRMEKIASQLKLPNTTGHVSDSENLRNIETRIENSVLDDFESVMKEAKIQTNIRLAVVNGDDERIQRVMSSSKNVSAHQVLDKMCQLKRLKPKNKRKPSLSPKSRMFKFKTKMLQRNRSQMDPHHVMDSNIVTYMSSSSRAKFGFKWKEHNSRYWGRLRQTRLHMRHKWKSKHLRAVVGLQNNPSYALDVVIKPVLECNTTAAIFHDCFLGSLWEKKSVSWLGLACVLAECMMHTTTVISAKLYSLFSFEVDTEENISSGLSQTSQVWEPGGVLAEHILVDWSVDFHDYAEIVEGIRCLVIGVCSGIQQPIDSRRASRVWERGGVDIILVMHWLETLGTCVVVQRVNQKLAAMYFGPFQVVERIGVVIFKDQTLPRKIAAALDSFAPVFMIVILVVIDRLSKAVHVLGLKHPFKPGWEIGVH